MDNGRARQYLSWRGAIIEAELRARQGAPAFAYQRDYRSPIDGGRWGASHALDISLVFGNLEASGSRTGTGADALCVSRLLQDALIAFARKCNPNARGDTGQERALFEQVPFVQRGTF